MQFNSFQFFLFFPVTTILYFLLPHKFRWLLLLVASCVFYCAFIPAYLLILLFIITIDYVAGIRIEKSEGRTRKLFLILSLASNIGILCLFKYYTFLTENTAALFNLLHIPASFPVLNILLPLGLSFHTFQAMSYTIEVYRGNQKAERHLGIYALYVMFYPQLVAGPIERPQNLLPQFHERKYLKYENVSDGLKIMLWGFFKKIVVADRLAIFVNHVFGNLTGFSPTVITIAVVFFSFQVYCDFSAYSDIAIGAAKVMGFHLMTNFNHPYHARSISEFWKRWHISLSTWFRDYLYIPLGGNRVGVPRMYFNLLIVFIISGLWHGANWTFAAWGCLHGLYLIYTQATRKTRKKIVQFIHLDKVKWLHHALQTLATFAFVTFAWIFFRARNMAEARYVIKSVFLSFRQIAEKLFLHKTLPLNMALGPQDLIIVLLSILLMEIVRITVQYHHVEKFKRSPLLVRWSAYYILIAIIAFFGVFTSYSFIYFQF